MLITATGQCLYTFSLILAKEGTEFVYPEMKQKIIDHG